MPLWGSKDQANNAPKYKILANSPANGNTLFGTAVVGLDNGEIAAGNHGDHSGWVRVIRGVGPVANIAITAAGTGYANADTVKVSGGLVNAAATITTNGAGAIQTVTVTNPGGGFTNVSSATVAITTSAGTGATLTPALAGRAGRVQTEVLVAMGSMTANNSTLA